MTETQQHSPQHAEWRRRIDRLALDRAAGLISRDEFTAAVAALPGGPGRGSWCDPHREQPGTP